MFNSLSLSISFSLSLTKWKYISNIRVDEQTVICVCVYFFWTSGFLDVPAGATREKGHTGFLIHLLSAVLALIFLARRIQPFLSLVDREDEFCILTIQSFSTCWAFYFILFLVRKNHIYRDSNSRPNVSEGFEDTN